MELRFTVPKAGSGIFILDALEGVLAPFSPFFPFLSFEFAFTNSFAFSPFAMESASSSARSALF